MRHIYLQTTKNPATFAKCNRALQRAGANLWKIATLMILGSLGTLLAIRVVTWFIVGALAGGGLDGPLTAIVLALLVAVFLVPVWISLRIGFADVIFSINPSNQKPYDTIKQSWAITEGRVIKLFIVCLLAWVVTLPVTVVLEGWGRTLLGPKSSLGFLIDTGLEIVIQTALLPYWHGIRVGAMNTILVDRAPRAAISSDPVDLTPNG